MICGLCSSVKICPSSRFCSCRSHEVPTMWDLSVKASEPDPSEHMQRWIFCWFVLVSFPVGEDEDEFENFLLPLTVWFKVSLRYLTVVLNKKKQRQVYFYYRGRNNAWEELIVGQALSSKLGTSAVSLPGHLCICMWVSIPEYICLIRNLDSRGTKVVNTILDKLCTTIFKGIGISPVFCRSGNPI